MKIIVTFSGGKDSLAALLWVRNNMTTNFIAVFCDTGWESEITYMLSARKHRSGTTNMS